VVSIPSQSCRKKADNEKAGKCFFKLMNRIERIMKTSGSDLNSNKCLQQKESNQKLKQHIASLKCRQSYYNHVGDNK